MEIYCICMFYLNEQTICLILGKHIKCTPYNTPFIQIQQTQNGLPNADINNSILNGGEKRVRFIIFNYNEYRLSSFLFDIQ